MKTGPSTKIIFHWILVTLITVLSVYNIEFSKIGFSLLIGLLLLTLIFNQTTYLNLKNGQLKITKKNFLFISTFHLSFNLNKTDEITIIDYRENNPDDISSVVDFEGVILIDILTGAYFYKPTNKLIIGLAQNKLIEIEINTQRKDILKIIQDLKKNDLKYSVNSILL